MKIANAEGRASRLLSRRTVLASGIAGASLSMLPGAAVGEKAALRVASLKFGSFNWLLETIRAEGIAEKLGLSLDVVTVATNQAGPVALLGREVDVIISDWPWAMRQRSQGEPFRFHPYSTALGAIMVPVDSKLDGIADLKGKKLGVAGSSIDKSWLMLRAYAAREYGFDLAKDATPVFGAAPLISEQIRSARVDAALNFWTYSARLKGNGFRELATMATVLGAMKIDPVPAMVGFVYREDVREDERKRQALKLYFAAIEQGNAVLAESDAAWERLRPQMRVKSNGELIALRDVYRSGIPKTWTGAHTASAQAIFELLRSLGERSLLSRETRFDAELFDAIGN